MMRFSSRVFFLIVALSLILGAISCSPIKPVTVATETRSKLTIGEHNYCIYDGQRLICLPQAKLDEASQSTFLFFDQEQEEQFAERHYKFKRYERASLRLEDILFLQGAELTAMVEHELKRGDSTLIEVAVFDTKFSRTPVDYSVWDCFVTGKGSPALECTLMKSPDSEEREFYLRMLETERLGFVIKPNEASAVGSMRTINTAEVTYASTYPDKGFAGSLGVLGGTGSTPSSAHALLIDNVLGCATMPCIKNGYRFIIMPGAVSSPDSYTVTANPVTVGETGTWFFYTDESGVIRCNTTRPASVADAPMQ
jgi:type IV pilus assembly protein PilA